MNFLIEIASFLAGLVDSIVGGGGLITVPVFIEVVGPNAKAIGTNKLPALAAQMIAAWVYFSNQRPPLKLAAACLLTSGAGAALGAAIAPLLPSWFFNSIPLVISPIILILVFTRSAWTRSIQAAATDLSYKARRDWAPIAAAGAGVFSAGVYDGLAGPGGGTLMFIALFFLGKLNPILAMGLGKVANLGSAASSFTSFAYSESIVWDIGLRGVIPILVGSWLGARLIVRQERLAGADRVRSIARVALGAIALVIAVRFGLRLL